MAVWKRQMDMPNLVSGVAIVALLAHYAYKYSVAVS